MCDYFGLSALGYLLTLGSFTLSQPRQKFPAPVITPRTVVLKQGEVSHATFLKKKNIYNFNSEVDFLFVAL